MNFTENVKVSGLSIMGTKNNELHDKINSNAGHEMTTILKAHIVSRGKAQGMLLLPRSRSLSWEALM